MGLRWIYLLMFFFVSIFSYAIDISKLESDLKTNPENLNARNQLAIYYFDNQKYDDVIRVYGSSIDKLDSKGLVILAKSYAKNKDSVRALKILDNAISQNPKSVDSYCAKAEVLLITNKERDALEAYRQAVEIDPKHEVAYLGMAQVYESKQNKYELRLLYQDMVEKFGEKSDYIKKLCEITTLDGLYDLSFEYCQKGVARFNTVDTNFVYLGIAYRETGETEKSEKQLKLAADKFLTSEFANYTYAQYLQQKKNLTGSYQYYLRAAKANPKSIKAALALADTAFELQKYDVAFDAYKTACDQKSKDATMKLRKNARALQMTKEKTWSQKYEVLAEKCGLGMLGIY